MFMARVFPQSRHIIGKDRYCRLSKKIDGQGAVLPYRQMVSLKDSAPTAHNMLNTQKGLGSSSSWLSPILTQSSHTRCATHSQTRNKQADGVRDPSPPSLHPPSDM